MGINPSQIIAPAGYRRELINQVINDFLNQGSLQGLGLSFNSVTQVDIGTGQCRTSDDADYASLTAALTLDITVAGAGGLQTGSSEAADTWYEVHLIEDSRNVNANSGLLIPAGTAFSEPNYDRNRRIGYVRNDASSNIVDFLQAGSTNVRQYLWVDAEVNRFALTNGPATNATPIDCSAFIPPTSRIGFLKFNNDGTKTVSFRLTALGAIFSTLVKNRTTLTAFPVDASQKIFYEQSGAGGSLDVVVTGYTDHL